MKHLWCKEKRNHLTPTLKEYFWVKKSKIEVFLQKCSLTHRHISATQSILGSTEKDGQEKGLLKFFKFFIGSFNICTNLESFINILIAYMCMR